MCAVLRIENVKAQPAGYIQRERFRERGITSESEILSPKHQIEFLCGKLYFAHTINEKDVDV